MNYKKKFILLSLVVVCCFSGIFANSDKQEIFNHSQNYLVSYSNIHQNKQNFDDVNFNSKSKYDFSIQTEKKSFRKGEKIAVKVTLKNTGSNFVRILYQLNGEEYSANKVKAKKTGLETLSLSQEGKKLVENPQIGSRSAKELNKGESYIYELELDKLFDLSAGTYQVTISRNLFIRSGKTKSWKQIEIESNPIQIIITE